MKSNSEKPRKLTGTEPLARYISEHKRLGNLLSFVLALAATIDNNPKIAMRALADVDKKGGENELEEQLKKADQEGAVSAFGGHFHLVKDMLVCRAVDNYLCYVTDLLSAIFRKRPETLKSNDQIRLDQVLAHDDMDALISFIADKKVNELAYQSMVDLKRYLKERLGFDLFKNEEQENEIIRAVLIRNHLVHTRGRISEKLLKTYSDPKLEVGDEIKLGTSETFDIILSLLGSAESIDVAASSKYGLPTTAIEFWEPFSSIRPKKIKSNLA